CTSNTARSIAFLSSAAPAATRTTLSADGTASHLAAIQRVLLDVCGNGPGKPVGETPVLARALAKVRGGDRQRRGMDEKRCERPAVGRRVDFAVGGAARMHEVGQVQGCEHGPRGAALGREAGTASRDDHEAGEPDDAVRIAPTEEIEKRL